MEFDTIVSCYHQHMQHPMMMMMLVTKDEGERPYLWVAGGELLVGLGDLPGNDIGVHTTAEKTAYQADGEVPYHQGYQMTLLPS